MSDTIDAEVARAVTALRDVPEAADISWHGGIRLPVRAVLGAMVGKLLIHGLDLARTVGRPWPIERHDALPVIDFFTAVAPHLVKDGLDVAATVEVRFRGYETATFELDDGALVVRTGRAAQPDVRMSVDPVSFVLMGYKRVGLAVPVLTGRALAWGRRPWLALRFVGLFEDP